MLVAFTRPRTIRDILVKSYINRITEQTASGPCGKSCKLCPYMLTCSTYTSHTTRSTHKIRHVINCQSVNVIYLIGCIVCGVQYVGQTSNTLNCRIRNHLYDIKREDQNKPVAKHFTSADHNAHDVTITGITMGLCDVNRRLRTCRRKLDLSTQDSKAVGTEYN